MNEYLIPLTLALVSTLVKYLLKYGPTFYGKKLRNYLLIVLPLFLGLILGIIFLSKLLYTDVHNLYTSTTSFWDVELGNGLLLPRLGSLSALILIYYISIRNRGFSDVISVDIVFLTILTLVTFFCSVLIEVLAREVAYGIAVRNFDTGVLMIIPFIFGMFIFVIVLSLQLIVGNKVGNSGVSSTQKRTYQEVKR